MLSDWGISPQDTGSFPDDDDRSMPTPQRIAKLVAVEKMVKDCLERIDEVWGEEHERKANATAFTRLAEAANLLERAGKKISKAMGYLEKPVKSSIR